VGAHRNFDRRELRLDDLAGDDFGTDGRCCHTPWSRASLDSIRVVARLKACDGNDRSAAAFSWRWLDLSLQMMHRSPRFGRTLEPLKLVGEAI
jgi:hypothetical protein